MCVGCGKTGHFRKVCQSRRERAVNELKVKGLQEGNEGNNETVSINSVHLNKNQSLLMAKLEMQSGRNSIVIPYKIDTGSEGKSCHYSYLKSCSKMLQKSNCENP